jgi:hypothetical protein
VSWGDRDKRRCSKKLHADKLRQSTTRGGTGAHRESDNSGKFHTLMACSGRFKVARPLFVGAFVRQCACFTLVAATLAAYSSTTLALCFALTLGTHAKAALG